MYSRSSKLPTKSSGHNLTKHQVKPRAILYLKPERTSQDGGGCASSSGDSARAKDSSRSVEGRQASHLPQLQFAGRAVSIDLTNAVSILSLCQPRPSSSSCRVSVHSQLYRYSLSCSWAESFCFELLPVHLCGYRWESALSHTIVNGYRYTSGVYRYS